MNNLTLIVDIGNTTTIFGVFDGQTLLGSVLTFTHKNSINEKEKMLSKFLYDNDYSIDKGMIFSVVPVENDNLKNLLKKVTKVDIKIFDPKTYTSLKCDVDNPKEIGADLIADIVGAKSLFGSNNLIVDLGTVTKILHTNINGVFDGCSFLPGLQTSLSLFNEKTALLPELDEFRKSSINLGKNTKEAMNHGVFWSTVSFIEKIQKHFKDDVKLILTGGNCQVIASEISNKIVEPDLSIKGMNLIFREMQDEL